MITQIKWWVVCGLILLGFTLWHSRQIFFYVYEPEYMENLYYHSQWNIPFSPRGISDGLLYQFVGYRLVEGENPFNINYEVPPLGKHLYGLAEHLLGNPYWVSLGLYLISLWLLYQLAGEVFVDKNLRPWAMLLFLSSPFVATQVKETMLDLPLTVFFLAHVWFFVRFIRTQTDKDLGLAGLFLGLATGTKFGAYTPPIIIAGSLFLIIKSRRLWPLLKYWVSVSVGYVLAWSSYFIHHPNPIPWARLHQKQFDFYFLPNSQVDHWNQWRGIFANSYQGWWREGATALGDWSPMLPLGIIALLVSLLWAIKHRSWQWGYLGLFVVSILGVNTAISFYPRYLMPLIPVLVLTLVFVSQKTKPLLFFLILSSLPFLHGSLAVKNYQESTQAVVGFIEKKAYRELYRSLIPQDRKTLTEAEFSAGLESFFEGLETRELRVEGEAFERTTNSAKVVARLQLATRYGKLEVHPQLQFVKVNNQLRLDWDWNYLWPGYTPTSKIVVENLGHIALAEIRDEGNRVVARRGPGKAVYVIPRVLKIPKETDLVAAVIGESGSETLGLIQRVVPADYPRYVGFLDPTLTDGEARALAIPGVTLKDIEYLVATGEQARPLIARARREKPELFFQEAEIYLVTETEKILLPLVRTADKNVILRF